MTQPGVHQKNLSITDLVDLVDLGAIALPDFQRPFEWELAQTRSLIATILMGWPAGSLLLMEAPPTDFFATRPIESGPPVTHKSTRHLVLDGQQRITSVYQAFSRRPGPFGYWYLDLDKWTDLDEIDTLEFALHQSDQVLRSPVRVPLSSLISDDTFLDWRGQVLSTIDDDLREMNYLRINKIWTTRLSRLRSYQFSSEILDRTMPLASVSKIFERLNTSGTPLGTFDLVVAHVYRDGRNLRSVWSALIERRPPLAGFVAEDPQAAIEVVALTTRGDTRRESLLALDANQLWDAWPSTIAGLNAAADFLSSEVGISGQSQLPHRAIYLILAALATETNLREHTVQLRHWALLAALTSRFDAAVNTRVVHDYRMLRDQLGKRNPAMETQFDARAFERATRRSSSSAWLGLQALLRRNGALDLPVGLVRDLQVGPSANAISIVGMNSSPTRAHDPVAGMVLCTAQTSQLIERQGAAELDRVLRESGDSGALASFCDSQLLPLPGDSSYSSDQQFIHRRAHLIENCLRRLALPNALDDRAASIDGVSDVDFLTEIATSRLMAGDAESAARALREVLSIRVRQGADHSVRIQDLTNLGGALSMGGQSREAIAVLQSALDLAAETGAGPDLDGLALRDAIVQEYLRVGDVVACRHHAEELWAGASLLLGVGSAVANRAQAILVVTDFARGAESDARHRWSELSRSVSQSGGRSRLGDYASQVFIGLIELGELSSARTFRDWPALGDFDPQDPSSIAFRQRSLGV